MRSKKEKKTFDEMFPHYDICFDCAKKSGGKPTPWPVTAWTAECPYCKKEKTLTSIRDYSFDEYNIKPIWD